MDEGRDGEAPPMTAENTAARTLNELKYPIARSYADIVYVLTGTKNDPLGCVCSC